MSQTAPQRNSQTVGEAINFSASCADLLDDGELVASVTVIDDAAPSPEVLSITNVAVNTSTLSINDVSVPVGEAVQWSASGFAADTDYTFKVTITTDATPPQVRIRLVIAPSDC